MLLHEIANRYGTPLSFLSVLASSLGLPVPSLPILAFIGGVAALSAIDTRERALSTVLLLSMAICGGLSGDLLWFAAGRRFGDRTIKAICKISLSRETCIKKTERVFGRHGTRILLVARFLPGLSLVCVPLAGAMGVRTRVFAAYDSVGLAMWGSAALALGAAFARQLDPLFADLSSFGQDAGLIAIAGFALYVGHRYWRRQLLLRSLAAERITVSELATLMAGPEAPAVLDIRSSERRVLDPFMIAGSLFADERDLAHVVACVPLNRKVVIYCSCPNEVSAAWMSKQMGLIGFKDVAALAGGLDAWRGEGQVVEPIPRDAGTDGVRDHGSASVHLPFDMTESPK